jgi:hypothetical protein
MDPEKLVENRLDRNILADVQYPFIWIDPVLHVFDENLHSARCYQDLDNEFPAGIRSRADAKQHIRYRFYL